MLLGVKGRWSGLTGGGAINLSRHVELHLELEDVNERFDEQVAFLKQFDKVFHVHMPFRLPDRSHVDFCQHYELIEQCVKLGDAINNGSYHLVVHCPCIKGVDWELIKGNVTKLLSKSSKVVLCFENLHGEDSFSFRSVHDFVELFNRVSDERVCMCLDVCHAYLFKKQRFDEFIDRVGHKVCHVHVSDVGKDFEHAVQIDEGIIDFNHVFNRLRSLQKELVIIPEVADSHLNDNAIMITAINRLKKLI